MLWGLEVHVVVVIGILVFWFQFIIPCINESLNGIHIYKLSTKDKLKNRHKQKFGDKRNKEKCHAVSHQAHHPAMRSHHRRNK